MIQSPLAVDGAKSDIWSLGCVLYQLAALEPPFNTTNMLALAKRIVEAKSGHVLL